MWQYTVDLTLVLTFSSQRTKAPHMQRLLKVFYALVQENISVLYFCWVDLGH